MAGHRRATSRKGRPRLVLVDNYDSFTHNLAHGLAAAGAEVEVVRNDAVALPDLLARRPHGFVLSPGPGHPANARDFGICADLIRQATASGKTGKAGKAAAAVPPVFGVCLGLQGMAHHTGGKVVRAPEPVHGAATRVRLADHPLFAGLPRTIAAGRYHSLVAKEASLPDEWRVIARGDGLVMGIAHRTRPLAGVQFHPESILTPHGQRLLRNVVRWCVEP